MLCQFHATTVDMIRMRTLVLCLAGHLAEKFDKVGQVITEELGLEDQVLARVVCGQGSSQKLGFSDNAQGRPPLGSLECHWPSVELLYSNWWWEWWEWWCLMAYPESEVGKTLGQAGQRLVPRSCLRHQRKGRRGASKVSAGKLDALGLAGLVLERA